MPDGRTDTAPQTAGRDADLPTWDLGDLYPAPDSPKLAADLDRADYSQLLPLAAFPAHRTLRIYEKGEVLAYGRSIMRPLYPVDEKILEVRFNFDGVKIDPVGNHGMTSFARGLQTASVLDGPDTAVLTADYTPWWKKPGAADTALLSHTAAGK